MRIIFGLAALALAGTSSLALAQPRAGAPNIPPNAPRGSYERQCTNIQMNGQFLSAVCRGARGGGQSSINVQSCSGDIGVDATGALSCAGPGAAVPAPPSVYAAPRPGYDPGRNADDARNADRRNDDRRNDDRRGYGDRSYGDRGYGDRGYNDRGYNDRTYGDRGGYGRSTLSLFGDRGFRGPAVRLDGPTANLAGYGLNDRVRSIALDPRSGPWLVCTDADYRGRCVTVDRSVADTRQIGMDRAISSLRPLR